MGLEHQEMKLVRPAGAEDAKERERLPCCPGEKVWSGRAEGKGPGLSSRESRDEEGSDRHE